MKGVTLSMQHADVIDGVVVGRNLIGGQWCATGSGMAWCSPAEPARQVYSGGEVLAHVDEAIAAARGALAGWRGLGFEKRCVILRKFQQISKARQMEMAERICDEVGKAMWESKAEASLLASKVDITLDQGPEGFGMQRVRDFGIAITASRAGRCVFRPHGVMGVVGPFNFPAHLPTGHIVPALAMGNTVVFKPSDKAPGVGQLLASFFDQALREGLAELGESYEKCGRGVINVVQGGVKVSQKLVGHEGLDGILFTGSWPVAKQIQLANIDRPGRILAFELGGSNAIGVMPTADLRAAAIEIARSAFATTGQRCTCTRRLVLHQDVARRVLGMASKIASNLVFADPRASHPVFAGPVISAASRDAVLDYGRELASRGGQVVMQNGAIESVKGGFYVSPGIVEVEGFTAEDWEKSSSAGADTEVFGPLLRVSLVKSFDELLQQVNATKFGLAAALFSGELREQEAFIEQVRAGCININTGTVGASSKLPFGGMGLSGNHRPAGSFASDYCVVPTAAMIESKPEGAVVSEGMRWEEEWGR
jgi:succinylglutamic semialdehyde dehydrogenase